MTKSQKSQLSLRKVSDGISSNCFLETTHFLTAGLSMSQVFSHRIEEILKTHKSGSLNSTDFSRRGCKGEEPQWITPTNHLTYCPVSSRGQKQILKYVSQSRVSMYNTSHKYSPILQKLGARVIKVSFSAIHHYSTLNFLLLALNSY